MAAVELEFETQRLGPDFATEQCSLGIEKERQALESAMAIRAPEVVKVHWALEAGQMDLYRVLGNQKVH